MERNNKTVKHVDRHYDLHGWKNKEPSLNTNEASQIDLITSAGARDFNQRRPIFVFLYIEPGIFEESQLIAIGNDSFSSAVYTRRSRVPIEIA